MVAATAAASGVKLCEPLVPAISVPASIVHKTNGKVERFLRALLKE